MSAEDKPLQAPSLLELSANVVARDRLLYKKCRPVPSSSSPAANVSFTLDKNPYDIVAKQICNNMRNENASADSVAENLRPFLDGKRQPLGRLDLSGLNISHRTLALLLEAQQSTLKSLDLAHIVLTSLDIRSGEICSILTDLKVKSLMLNSLQVTSCDLLRIPRFPVQDDSDQKIAIGNKQAYDTQKLSTAQETNLKLTRSLPHFVEFCPNIEHLYLLQGLLNNIKDETADQFLLRILKTLKLLRTLDLSEWHFPNHLRILKNAPKLTTLILYDVRNLESCISMISRLKNLRCLDLSQSERTTGHYLKPVTCLHTLVTELPNLEILDISGTNLTSDVSDDDQPFEGIDFDPSYIVGLSFLICPLKYLGIFNCDIDRDMFENILSEKDILAEKICCDQGEDQIILALEAYMSRPRMIEAVVKSYIVYRFGTCLKRYADALHLLLQVLSSHRTNRSLQVAGHFAMAFTFFVVKMNRDTKKAVLYELLYAMENHTDEQDLVDYCCISLHLFCIRRDFMVNYSQTAKQLMRVLMARGSSLDTQQIVLEILSSMAFRLDQSQKIHLASIGFIETIMALIRLKLAAVICDIVLQSCWTFICEMTYETPSICERFLEMEGMQLFSQCFFRFTNPHSNAVLVLNMISLVGNVAEVKCLRSQLMDNDYLDIYWSLLYRGPNYPNEFEISYSNAYVLAHLVSEGEAAWRSVRHKRSDVMDRIVAVIGTWDLKNEIHADYRSLILILQLLQMFGSHASQHWAVWALASLTSRKPEKYCRYVDKAGGEKLVQNLVYDTRVSARVSILARVVLANMDTWRNPGAITASTIQDETIVPARQNSNPYLKKVNRIMMRFLPIWLPVSTLVIASLYIGSYERAIHHSSRAIRPAS